MGSFNKAGFQELSFTFNANEYELGFCHELKREWGEIVEELTNVALAPPRDQQSHAQNLLRRIEKFLQQVEKTKPGKDQANHYASVNRAVKSQMAQDGKESTSKDTLEEELERVVRRLRLNMSHVIK